MTTIQNLEVTQEQALGQGKWRLLERRVLPFLSRNHSHQRKEVPMVPKYKDVKKLFAALAKEKDRVLDIRNHKAYFVNRGNGSEPESLIVEYRFNHGNGYRTHIAHFNTERVTVREWISHKSSRVIPAPTQLQYAYPNS